MSEFQWGTGCVTGVVFYSQHDDDDDDDDDNHDDHDDHDGDNAAADCDDDQQWNCFFTNQLEYNPLPWTKLSYRGMKNMFKKHSTQYLAMSPNQP